MFPKYHSNLSKIFSKSLSNLIRNSDKSQTNLLSTSQVNYRQFSQASLKCKPRRQISGKTLTYRMDKFQVNQMHISGKFLGYLTQIWTRCHENLTKLSPKSKPKLTKIWDKSHSLIWSFYQLILQSDPSINWFSKPFLETIVR